MIAAHEMFGFVSCVGAKRLSVGKTAAMSAGSLWNCPHHVAWGKANRLYICALLVLDSMQCSKWHSAYSRLSKQMCVQHFNNFWYCLTRFSHCYCQTLKCQNLFHFISATCKHMASDCNKKGSILLQDFACEGTIRNLFSENFMFEEGQWFGHCIACSNVALNQEKRVHFFGCSFTGYLFLPPELIVRVAFDSSLFFCLIIFVYVWVAHLCTGISLYWYFFVSTGSWTTTIIWRSLQGTSATRWWLLWCRPVEGIQTVGLSQWIYFAHFKL